MLRLRGSVVAVALIMLFGAPALTLLGSQDGTGCSRTFLVAQGTQDPTPGEACNMCYETCVYHAEVQRLKLSRGS